MRSFAEADYDAARAIRDLRFTREELHTRALGCHEPAPPSLPVPDSLNDLMRAFRAQITEMTLEHRVVMDDANDLLEFYRNKVAALEQELNDMEQA